MFLRRLLPSCFKDGDVGPDAELTGCSSAPLWNISRGAASVPSSLEAGSALQHRRDGNTAASGAPPILDQTAFQNQLLRCKGAAAASALLVDDGSWGKIAGEQWQFQPRLRSLWLHTHRGLGLDGTIALTALATFQSLFAGFQDLLACDDALRAGLEAAARCAIGRQYCRIQHRLKVTKETLNANQGVASTRSAVIEIGSCVLALDGGKRAPGVSIVIREPACGVPKNAPLVTPPSPQAAGRGHGSSSPLAPTRGQHSGQQLPENPHHCTDETLLAARALAAESVPVMVMAFACNRNETPSTVVYANHRAREYLGIDGVRSSSMPPLDVRRVLLHLLADAGRSLDEILAEASQQQGFTATIAGPSSMDGYGYASVGSEVAGSQGEECPLNQMVPHGPMNDIAECPSYDELEHQEPLSSEAPDGADEAKDPLAASPVLQREQGPFDRKVSFTTSEGPARRQVPSECVSSHLPEATPARPPSQPFAPTNRLFHQCSVVSSGGLSSRADSLTLASPQESCMGAPESGRHRHVTGPSAMHEEMSDQLLLQRLGGTTVVRQARDATFEQFSSPTWRQCGAAAGGRLNKAAYSPVSIAAVANTAVAGSSVPGSMVLTRSGWRLESSARSLGTRAPAISSPDARDAVDCAPLKPTPLAPPSAALIPVACAPGVGRMQRSIRRVTTTTVGELPMRVGLARAVLLPLQPGGLPNSSVSTLQGAPLLSSDRLHAPGNCGTVAEAVDKEVTEAPPLSPSPPRTPFRALSVARRDVGSMEVADCSAGVTPGCVDTTGLQSSESGHATTTSGLGDIARAVDDAAAAGAPSCVSRKGDHLLASSIGSSTIANQLDGPAPQQLSPGGKWPAAPGRRQQSKLQSGQAADGSQGAGAQQQIPTQGWLPMYHEMDQAIEGHQHPFSSSIFSMGMRSSNESQLVSAWMSSHPSHGPCSSSGQLADVGPRNARNGAVVPSGDNLVQVAARGSTGQHPGLPDHVRELSSLQRRTSIYSTAESVVMDGGISERWGADDSKPAEVDNSLLAAYGRILSEKLAKQVASDSREETQDMGDSKDGVVDATRSRDGTVDATSSRDGMSLGSRGHCGPPLLDNSSTASVAVPRRAASTTRNFTRLSSGPVGFSSSTQKRPNSVRTRLCSLLEQMDSNVEQPGGSSVTPVGSYRRVSAVIASKTGPPVLSSGPARRASTTTLENVVHSLALSGKIKQLMGLEASAPGFAGSLSEIQSGPSRLLLVHGGCGSSGVLPKQPHMMSNTSDGDSFNASMSHVPMLSGQIMDLASTDAVESRRRSTSTSIGPWAVQLAASARQSVANGGSTTENVQTQHPSGSHYVLAEPQAAAGEGEPPANYIPAAAAPPEASRGEISEALTAAAGAPPVDRSSWFRLHMRSFPGSGGESPTLLLIMQDVTDHVTAQERVSALLGHEHKILEALFPRHVIEFMTVIPVGMQGEAAKTSCTYWRGGAQDRHANGPDFSDASTVAGMRQLILQQQLDIIKVSHLATQHKMVTILFSDCVGFTAMCKQVPPLTVMHFLNELYQKLDALLDIYKVYKVETIGDCYVVAGGLVRHDADGCCSVLPEGDADELHAVRVMEFAKAMLRASREVMMPTTGQPVQLRMGLHSGPAMSGVVGSKMPRFTVFGETVEAANKMESNGQPGRIHVSGVTRELLQRETWAQTEGVQIDGRGRLDTYLWVEEEEDVLYKQRVMAVYL